MDEESKSFYLLSDSIFNQSEYSIGIGYDACMFSEVAKNMYCVPFEVEQDYGDIKA